MSNLRQDFVQLNLIKSRCIAVLPITSSISLLALSVYIAHRVKYIFEYSQLFSEYQTVFCSTLYLLVEIGFFLPNFLNHLLRCLAAPSRARNRDAHPDLLDDHNPPAVDIFITCAGEDPDIVLNTAEAACASDYPSSALRVFVLDDAGSEELSKRVSVIKQDRVFLHYAARKKGKDHNFKAGNLNYGYQHAEQLDGEPAPFIAALDADMIPDPKWLRALMPHLIEDAKLALIQPPQRFYDVPSPDLLLQGLDVNYRMTEPLRETMGSTWCGGSGYVIRRAALDSIGGFPTGTIGEDLHCSNVLLGKGWKTRHVDESLQQGRVPESYKTHIKQQSRWHVGRIQVAVAMRFYLFGDQVKKLSFRQRCAALIATVLSLTNITTTISLILLPSVLLLGRPLVISSDHQGHRRLLLLVIAAVLSEWLDDCVVSLITGYKIAMSEAHTTYWAAPYHAAALMKAFLPQRIFPSIRTFDISGSSSTSRTDDMKGKSPLKQRAIEVFWDGNVLFHVLYILSLILAIARSLAVISHAIPQTTASWTTVALAYLGWPPLLFLNTLSSMMVPTLYVFLPSSIPNRDQLLKRDPLLRASYPREHDDSQARPFWVREDVWYSVCVFYTLLMGLFL